MAPLTTYMVGVYGNGGNRTDGSARKKLRLERYFTSKVLLVTEGR